VYNYPNFVGQLSDKDLTPWHFMAYSMPTRYTVVCDDDLAAEIDRLAQKNQLTDEEVIRQLVGLGLDRLDEEAPA
jgi:hypothetical protein